jgi:hypothetical protein
MDDFHIDLDPGLDEKVAKIPELLTDSKDAAEQIADVARGTAPVQSGAYVDGIEVQETKSGARVFASDYKSAWIEFGVPSQGQPAHFNLRKAAESAGYEFKKRGG